MRESEIYKILNKQQTKHKQELFDYTEDITRLSVKIDTLIEMLFIIPGFSFFFTRMSKKVVQRYFDSIISENNKLKKLREALTLEKKEKGSVINEINKVS